MRLNPVSTLIGRISQAMGHPDAYYQDGSLLQAAPKVSQDAINVLLECVCVQADPIYTANIDASLYGACSVSHVRRY